LLLLLHLLLLLIFSEALSATDWPMTLPSDRQLMVKATSTYLTVKQKLI
jgi:hypothetical protein